MGPVELAWLLARFLAGCWLLWRVPVPRPGATVDRGAVTCVVPARDEAARLPPLLRSLGPQLRAEDEMIVVDDHSTDATATVAAAAGATVVSAPPLPAGWTGKTWACSVGASRAANPTIVFLDADTEIGPSGLDLLVAEHRDSGGLLSVQPFHAVRRPHERLSAFFNVVGMMGTDAFTPLGARLAPRGAFGPVLVTSAPDYAAVGGHEAVRNEVLDDVALAAAYREAGLPVCCLGGRGVVRFRMYADGLRSLVEGWSKNFASGAAHTRPLTLVLVVGWLSLCIVAAWGVLRLPFGGAVVPAVALYAAVAVQLHWMLRRIGSFGASTALLYPVPLAFFLAVFLRSIALVLVRGRVRWRGREIPTRLQAGGGVSRKIVRRK